MVQIGIQIENWLYNAEGRYGKIVLLYSDTDLEFAVLVEESVASLDVSGTVSLLIPELSVVAENEQNRYLQIQTVFLN